MTPFYHDPFEHPYINAPANDVISTLKFANGKQKYHSAFTGPLAEYVTGSDQMTVLIGKLEAARDDVLAGETPVKKAALEALVAEGVNALKFNAQHLILVSQHRNDPSLLYDAGYEFKAIPNKVKVHLLDLVPELDGKLGPVEGSVIITLKNRPSSRVSCELQMTDNPNDDQSWRQVGEGIYNSARAEVRGLEPVKRMYFRARYHENGAVGRWSAPFCIIVH